MVVSFVYDGDAGENCGGDARLWCGDGRVLARRETMPARVEGRSGVVGARYKARRGCGREE